MLSNIVTVHLLLLHNHFSDMTEYFEGSLSESIKMNRVETSNQRQHLKVPRPFKRIVEENQLVRQDFGSS